MASEAEIMGGYGIGGDPFFGSMPYDDPYEGGYEPIRNEPMGDNYNPRDFPSNKAYQYNPMSTNSLHTRDLYTTPIVGKDSYSVEADFIANNTNNPKDYVVKYPSNLQRKQSNAGISNNLQPANYPADIAKEHMTTPQKKCGCRACNNKRNNFMMQNDIQHFIMFFLIIILVFVIVNQSMLSKRIDSVLKMIAKNGK